MSDKNNENIFDVILFLCFNVDDLCKCMVSLIIYRMKYNRSSSISQTL